MSKVGSDVRDTLVDEFFGDRLAICNVEVNVRRAQGVVDDLVHARCRAKSVCGKVVTVGASERPTNLLMDFRRDLANRSLDLVFRCHRKGALGKKSVDRLLVGGALRHTAKSSELV